MLAAYTASGSQQPPAISTPAPQEPSLTPTSVPAILPTPSTVVSLEERLLATIDIKYPDELAFVQGFIWVKTDGENIWACSASGDEDHRTIDVVRIDPNSQSVVETVRVGKIFDQFNIPFLLNQIWVLSGNGDKLVGIDITTNQPSPAIDLGARCFQVAAVNSSLLVTCRMDNLVLRIDPEKMEVAEEFSVPSPRKITATENGIWLSQDNAVVRLDSESLTPVATFTKLFNADIFGTKEAVWVRLEAGFLYRIDPLSNQLIEQIKTDQGLSIGSMLVTPDSIWTTAGDDDLLIRLNLK